MTRSGIRAGTREGIHPLAFPENRSSFEDKNGQWVQIGDQVIYIIDHREGILSEALPDGDAFVTWRDGTYGTVKWRHLLKRTMND